MDALSQRRALAAVRAAGRPRGLEAGTLAWLALAALLVGAAAFMYHETRGTTIGPDDWNWALQRRGNSLTTFLRPWNEHLSLIPIAIYRLLFATAGLGDYSPYRALAIAAHLVIVVLVFVYAKRRVGHLLALLAAALILFLGPGWQEVLWPFQIAWLISLGAGLGALLALDRRGRRADLGASALLAVSLASSGIGVPVALGLCVDLVVQRRRWRDAWIVAAPLALYALWWVTYQQASVARSALVLAPSFAAQEAAAALSAVLGLGGQSLVTDGQGTLLTWGAPLLVAGVGVLAWRVARARATAPRALTLLTMALTFWAITAISRAGAPLITPFDSRYVYVGGLFVALLAIELAGGVALSRRAALVIVIAAAAVVTSNVGVFRAAGAELRIAGQAARADMGALDLSRPIVSPSFHPAAWVGFANYTAATYFSIERAIGSPAATPAQIAGAVEPARLGADAELIGIQRLHLAPPASGVRLGATPRIDSSEGGGITRRGACVTLQGPTFTPTGGSAHVALTVPDRGLLISAAGGPTSLAVRRFANEFQAVGTLAASSSGTFRVRPDSSNFPWHLRLTPSRRVTACGLA